ncbi:MAG: lipopolysaccharide heptosyltransferase II [Pseudomonadales bacterium]|nr:lipopolysaccharide heptosyltransferase II [Pseudomonadales bacterium]
MGPRRILIVGAAWVGDMVMSQPLFSYLHQVYGATTRIDVLAPAWSRPVLTRMVEVNRVLELPWGHGRLGLGQRWQLGRSLRPEGYDQAIVLPNSWKSAWVPWAAAIPQRTGWRGEWRYGLLNDLRMLDAQVLPRMVDRFMALAVPRRAALPEAQPPRLQVDAALLQQTLLELNLDHQGPLIALCPGAEFGSSKQWPARHFSNLAQQLLQQGYQVWIMGSAADAGIAQMIMEAIPDHLRAKCHSLAGKTRLDQAIDLLSCPDVVVSNDSGLMHIAAAIRPDRLLLALYGSTSPVFTPPLAPAAHILRRELSCSPCFKRECPLGHHACMEELMPHDVMAWIHP